MVWGQCTMLIRGVHDAECYRMKQPTRRISLARRRPVPPCACLRAFSRSLWLVRPRNSPSERRRAHDLVISPDPPSVLSSPINTPPTRPQTMSSDPTSKYSNELQLLAPLFPDWDDQALAFVLADTRGNVEDAALMISEGECERSPMTSGVRQRTERADE